MWRVNAGGAPACQTSRAILSPGSAFPSTAGTRVNVSSLPVLPSEVDDDVEYSAESCSMPKEISTYLAIDLQILTVCCEYSPSRRSTTVEFPLPEARFRRWSSLVVVFKNTWSGLTGSP